MIEELIRKISVVLCTYNGEKYLAEQLDTILGQTYPVYELIIQDDCSTDGTVALLNEYADRNSFIKLFVNKERKGYSNNFYSAMNLATGDYIAISDQDDIWEKDKIEQQLQTIGDAYLCCNMTKPFSVDDSEIYYDLRIPNHGLERLAFYAVLAGHTMMMKKDLLMYLHYATSGLAYDHLIAILAEAYDRTVVCEKILTHHRRHPSASSFSTKKDYSKKLTNMISYFFSSCRSYKRNEELMRDHFVRIHTLYTRLPLNTSKEKDILKMTYLLSQKRSFLSFWKIGILSVKLREGLFHTKENNYFLSVMRAFFNQVIISRYYNY